MAARRLRVWQHRPGLTTTFPWVGLCGGSESADLTTGLVPLPIYRRRFSSDGLGHPPEPRLKAAVNRPRWRIRIGGFDTHGPLPLRSSEGMDLGGGSAPAGSAPSSQPRLNAAGDRPQRRLSRWARHPRPRLAFKRPKPGLGGGSAPTGSAPRFTPASKWPGIGLGSKRRRLQYPRLSPAPTWPSIGPSGKSASTGSGSPFEPRPQAAIGISEPQRG